jgi:hypothetical protein
METIKTRARVGKDGLLKLEVPLEWSDVDLEVLLVVQPLPADRGDREEWLAFIERTAGSLAEDPIERPPQGEYEVREPLE